MHLVENAILKLLSTDQLTQLLANASSAFGPLWFDEACTPVALLRCSCGDFYLLGALDPTEPTVVYCLYEDSEGTPMLDTVDFEAMADSSEGTSHGFDVMRGFIPTQSIGAYFDDAVQRGSVRALFDGLV